MPIGRARERQQIPSREVKTAIIAMKLRSSHSPWILLCIYLSYIILRIFCDFLSRIRGVESRKFHGRLKHSPKRATDGLSLTLVHYLSPARRNTVPLRNLSRKSISSTTTPLPSLSPLRDPQNLIYFLLCVCWCLPEHPSHLLPSDPFHFRRASSNLPPLLPACPAPSQGLSLTLSVDFVSPPPLAAWIR
jgi:hypothetical protein